MSHSVTGTELVLSKHLLDEWIEGGFKEQPYDNGLCCKSDPGPGSSVPSSLPSSLCWLLVLGLSHYRPKVAVTASGITSALKCLKLEGVFLEALISFSQKQKFPRNFLADFVSSRKAGKCLEERNGKADIGWDQCCSFLGVWHSAAANQTGVLL